MGNCLLIPTKTPPKNEEKIALLPPIEQTSFKLPSPLPSWPSGGGFGKGNIDLGGLQVCQISTFTKVWSCLEGGQGATFFSPSQIPAGFFALGSYAQPNNKPLFGWVLVAKHTSDEASLAKPVDYTLIWSSESSDIKQVGHGYFWLPVAPEGYRAVGHIITNTPNKPSVDDVRCVRNDFTEECEPDEQIWYSGDMDGFNVHSLRPTIRGTKALGVSVGTFVSQSKGSSSPNSTFLACLKNKDYSNFSSMPNLSQIQALVQAYSPWIHFHPDEAFLPSSVTWFFENGALIYQNSNANPTQIDSNGSNLPQGGSNDGQYWLDLPSNTKEKERVMKGNLPSSTSYLHIKPMLGATFTDIAVWIFYPFNGPATAKVELFNIKLGKVGEHVGDWEHLTLRISNFNGELQKLYFSEHSRGTWVDASQLEFEEGGGNKPVTYASLNGHALYSKTGLVLQGPSGVGIGIRNDAARGKEVMDTGARCEIVSAGYLAVKEPAWLNYMREWGPKIRYDVANELKAAERLLPEKLRVLLEDVVDGLPAELMGEEGPTGPKDKKSWTMDEA